MVRFGILLCPFLLPIIATSSLLSAQGQPPQSDPQALSLVAQSISALTNGATINDATLSGTAIWTVASDNETASATLMVKGTSESRFDMTLSSGSRSEIRNDGSSTVLGELTAPDGSILQWSLQNCMVNAAWFFPQLSVLGETGNSALIFHYVGQENKNGGAVQHIQSYLYSSANTATIQLWSTTDIYLDMTSLLPAAFAFNVYSIDGSQTIPVEVDFSNYQTVSGAQIPFRIQRYVAGNLGLDFSATSAQLNSGLQDSQFAIQ